MHAKSKCKAWSWTNPPALDLLCACILPWKIPKPRPGPRGGNWWEGGEPEENDIFNRGWEIKVEWDFFFFFNSSMGSCSRDLGPK